MGFLVQTFKKPRVSLSCQCSLERNIKSVFHFSSFDSSLNILTLAISPHTSGGSNTQMSQSLWCPTHTHTPVSHTALCVYRQNLSLPIPHTARSLFNVSDRLHQTNSSAPPRTYTLHGPPSMLLVISSVACMKIRDGKGDQTMNKWDSSCERRSEECREWIERGKERKRRKTEREEGNRGVCLVTQTERVLSQGCSHGSLAREREEHRWLPQSLHFNHRELFVRRTHACHLHSILLDTLQWRPTEVAPGAPIRWPAHRFHNSTGTTACLWRQAHTCG